MQIFRYLFYILGQNNAYFLRFGIFLLKLFVNFLLCKGKNRTFAAVLWISVQIKIVRKLKRKESDYEYTND